MLNWRPFGPFICLDLPNQSGELRMDSADSFCKRCRRREVYTVSVWWTRRCRWAYLGDDALAEEAREFHQRCGLDSLSTNRHSLGRLKWRRLMSWPWNTELSFFRSLFLAESVSQLSLFPSSACFYRTLFPAHCGKASRGGPAGRGRDPPGQSPHLRTVYGRTHSLKCFCCCSRPTSSIIDPWQYRSLPFFLSTFINNPFLGLFCPVTVWHSWITPFTWLDLKGPWTLILTDFIFRSSLWYIPPTKYFHTVNTGIYSMPQ